jgi:hypothetical protein
MVESRSGPRLLLEAAQPVSVFGKRGGQNLDRDFAVEACVTRAVDFAHSARAELREDAIVGDSGWSHSAGIKQSARRGWQVNNGNNDSVHCAHLRARQSHSQARS